MAVASDVKRFGEFQKFDVCEDYIYLNRKFSTSKDLENVGIEFRNYIIMEIEFNVEFFYGQNSNECCDCDLSQKIF